MSETIETKAPGGNVLLGNRVDYWRAFAMSEQITLAEALDRVTFESDNEGGWYVVDVVGNINGVIRGNVGAVSGDVGNVLGNVQGGVTGNVGGGVGGNVCGDVGAGDV